MPLARISGDAIRIFLALLGGKSFIVAQLPANASPDPMLQRRKVLQLLTMSLMDMSRVNRASSVYLGNMRLHHVQPQMTDYAEIVLKHGLVVACTMCSAINANRGDTLMQRARLCVKIVPLANTNSMKVKLIALHVR